MITDHVKKLLIVILNKSISFFFLSPFCFKIVDARARGGKLLPHFHVEPIDDVDGIDLPAIEATSKLDEIDTLAECFPLAAKLLRGYARRRSCVHGIEDLALLKGLIPRQAERLLELLRSIGSRND